MYATDEVEIRGLIGLLYYRAMFSQNLESIVHLFDEDNESGHPVFGATMSRSRFAFLLGRLSFDDKTTRAERWQHDRFAAMRSIFEKFNLNCSKHMNPPEYLAIDETLYPSRGKIAFKQYNPMKPAKYGLLIQSLNAVKFPYTFSMIVSAGKPANKTGPYYVNK